MGGNQVATQCPRGKVVLIIIITGLAGAVIGSVAMWTGIHFSSLIQSPLSEGTAPMPNFVIFLADDVGYGDFQVYGHPTQEWTGVDRMAKEGKRLTQFYTPVAVCTPSRAAILTGRYPVRTGVYGQDRVFIQISSGGLPRREVTIAEALKEDGYVSGMTGKWHLGINKFNSTDGYHLPMHHGFDSVNTILPFTQNWLCQQHKSYIPAMSDSCFLYENDKIVEQPINLGSLTAKLLKDTINFITNHKDDRFFYLISFPQTHEALFANTRFSGKSKRGPYGDNINEMGWAINEVLDHIVELGIGSKTFALFLSDHGAVRRGCGEDGSNGPFQGGKLTTWEGGVRVPAVAWWPGVIEPNSVSHAVLSTLDILPTFKKLASDVLVNEGHASCFFNGPESLQEYAIQQRCENNFVMHDPPLMFDLESDIEEHIALNSESPRYREILTEITKHVGIHTMSIEVVESEINKPILPMLKPCCDPPACMCNYEE